ncbi:Jag N-terminal domain-containing protein [bacterium]|nr:Jag N-terminal domain-containing protein [bacterium]MBU1990469.1 Jag N-terminal domain-containing protein [bacterium]
MIKIESTTLEEAYKNAASSLECSVTELKIEVIQYPSKGVLGLFKKTAIIVATKDFQDTKADTTKQETAQETKTEIKTETKTEIKTQENKQAKKVQKPATEPKKDFQERKKDKTHTILNDTIMPASFVSTQEDEEDNHYEPVYADDFYEEDDASHESILEIAKSVKKDINALFDLICFKIDEIEVSAYDESTLLVEFKGEDAALLIGKEGYRYKALSYMIFNWINTKYQVQLRLEIAEFLKNQEESVSRYLVSVCESVERDGRAQTKILDGVLVQIALKELREVYPDKYVAIRSTRDGLKYIIINDYHNN